MKVPDRLCRCTYAVWDDQYRFLQGPCRNHVIHTKWFYIVSVWGHRDRVLRAGPAKDVVFDASQGEADELFAAVQ